MKPTVINSSTNTNPQHQQQHPSSADSNNNSSGQQSQNGQQPRSYGSSSFQHPFDEDDDMFYGFPSRMRDAFNWGGRKRTGSMSNDTSDGFDDPYFRSADVFPRFGSSRRPASSSHRDGFFNIPSEFRQYMPDEFGFPSMRQQPSRAQQYVAPQQYNTPVQSQPRYCDAAMQTDDPSGPSSSPCSGDMVDHAVNTDQPTLNQHGMRNTVDLGQKSAPEQVPLERAQSDPPRNHQMPAQPQTNSASAFASADGGNSFANAQAQSDYNNPQDASNQYRSYYYPHDQPQPDAAHARRSQGMSPPPRQQSNSDGQFVRTVPIFIEGSNVPVTPGTESPSSRQFFNQHQQHPRQYQTQAQAYAQSPPQAPPRRQTNQPRPEPMVPKTQEQILQTAGQEQGTGVPPQTPHTTDCITKIQDIQRDVLDLMGRVEQFNGLRNDKDYLYLDEMLTRNLLKLDTIDTNGKDSIRLARKEAIKCIQASIQVLEAKAEANAKGQQKSSEEMNVVESKEQQTALPEEVEIPKQLDPNVAIPLKNLMDTDETPGAQPAVAEKPSDEPKGDEQMEVTEQTADTPQNQDVDETKPKPKTVKKLIKKIENKAKGSGNDEDKPENSSDKMDTSSEHPETIGNQ